jgi:hypothetical protein
MLGLASKKNYCQINAFSLSFAADAPFGAHEQSGFEREAKTNLTRSQEELNES